MAWGNDWAEEAAPIPKKAWDNIKPVANDWLTHTSDDTAYIIFKERSNKVPTHDPYTNPNSELYYSCECGQVLDPGTKSFAALNNAASIQGWKIRFGAMYYVAHCPKCGEGIDG